MSRLENYNIRQLGQVRQLRRQYADSQSILVDGRVYHRYHVAARDVCKSVEGSNSLQHKQGCSQTNQDSCGTGAPSVPRTVRTADSGFHQEGELELNENIENPSTSSSSNGSVSPSSSSVARTNVDLRKERVLPLRRWAREKTSLCSAAVVSPQPMLSSTPHEEGGQNLAKFTQPIPALETSILGDVTNIGSDESVRNGDVRLNDDVHRDDVHASLRMPAYADHRIREATNAEPSHVQCKTVPRVDPDSELDHVAHRKVYKEVERKLVEQLRNAIAHLDFADMEQRIKSKELEMAYKKFYDDVREFEQEKEAEKERTQRVRRQLEMEKRMTTKHGVEREKIIAEQVEDLTKTINQKDRQISILRVRLRKAEELAESREKELQYLNKKIERLEKSCKALQRQVAQFRANQAKQSQEMAAELLAARAHNLRRKGVGTLPVPYHQQSHLQETPAVDNGGITSGEAQKGAQQRLKGVSWADKTAPAEVFSEAAEPKKESYVMELVETADFGRLRLFKNSMGTVLRITVTRQFQAGMGRLAERCKHRTDDFIFQEKISTAVEHQGDWTKVTNTDCRCELYEYSNSDICWLSCDRTIEVNYFGSVGATVITLSNGCSIRYFNTGQIELYRLSGEISRFDGVTKRRIETMIHPDQTRYVEMYDGFLKTVSCRFDSRGCCLRLDDSGKNWERFGERSSYRGYPSDRHVYNHSNVEPEWIEPEYNARRCPDGSLKIKFANVMVCCLGVEDVGYVKHITRLENGSERKLKCVEWGRVARAAQREIETLKCQRLTALNATL